MWLVSWIVIVMGFTNYIIIRLLRVMHHLRYCSSIRVRLWMHDQVWPLEIAQEFMNMKALWQASLILLTSLLSIINLILVTGLWIGLFQVHWVSGLLGAIFFLITILIIQGVPLYYRLRSDDISPTYLLKSIRFAKKYFKIIGQWVLKVIQRMIPSLILDKVYEVEHISDLIEEVKNLDESRLLLNLRKFETTLVKDVMTPRAQVVALEINDNLGHAIHIIDTSGCSRLPVYKEDLNHMVGILYAKDLLNLFSQDSQVKIPSNLLRSPIFVQEVQHIRELFFRMQLRNIHMALVVDEFGRFQGVIALEDILEELLGEIRDEFDFGEKDQIEIIEDDQTYLVDGHISLQHLESLLKIEFDRTADYDTLSGFMLSQSQKVPEIGEILTYNGWEFQVKERNPRFLEKVLMQRIKPAKSLDT